MFTLERRLLSSSSRPLRAGLRWYSESGEGSSSSSSSHPSSLSQPTSTPATSTPNASESSGEAGASSSSGSSRPIPPEAANLDQLWRNALSAPAAALKHAPRTHARSLLAFHTPTPRAFKGMRRTRRAEGQTPHEAGTFNATLGKILSSLVNKSWNVEGGSTFRVPSSAKGKSLNHLTNAPDAWRRSAPRVEDDDATLVAEIDALKEELSGLLTPGEAVAWAQGKVFTRRPEGDEVLPGGETPRTTWPRTYPRALAALINTLWMRMNSPHLALAMFEHARTLSVESYLAGCQTSAYNELVRVHWEAFRDLSAVLVAVQEMDSNAVAWDRYTAGFVGGIVDAAGRELLDLRSKNATHRWGSDAYNTLARLENYVAADREREESKYERRTSIKRRVRQGHMSM